MQKNVRVNKVHAYQEQRLVIFKALANVNRLVLIDHLRSGALTVGELVKKTKLEQSQVSHALKYLSDYCFVYSEREGKNIRYSLNRETILPLIILADEHVKAHHYS